jgi:tripartite-type tricarboxylate transporter receptor subunit TctC
MERMISVLAAIATTVGALLPFAAQSEAPSEFFKGKTVLLYIGQAPGGAYDAYGRLITRHMGKYIPGNPTVVPMNMPGAGTLRLANWLYNAAPKDGTVIGTIGMAAAFEPLVGEGAKFDATKFGWIGSANNETSTCVVMTRSKIAHFDDLKKHELVMGSDGPAANAEQFARVMNGFFGTKIRIVSGYTGGQALGMALEQGEIDGRCGWSWGAVKSTHGNWLTSGDARVILQIGHQKHPDLPHVPLLSDFATTDEQRSVLRLTMARLPLARPYVAPPGVPTDRLEALRKAFIDTMQDPEFQAEANKAQLELRPLSGDEAGHLVADVFRNTPPQVVAKTKELFGTGTR